MSLKTIAEGFTHLLFTNKDIERIANARAYICNGCPVSEYGKSRYCKLTNGGCGCYLPAKRRAMSEECPLKKWGSEIKRIQEENAERKERIAKYIKEAGIKYDAE